MKKPFHIGLLAAFAVSVLPTPAALAVAGLPRTSRTGGEVTDGLQLLIEADTDTFLPGDPVILSFHFRNLRGQPAHRSVAGAIADYSLEVIEDSERRVPSKEEIALAAAEAAGGSCDRVSSRFPVTIQPGAEQEESMDLAEHYLLTPGSMYSVTASTGTGNQAGDGLVTVVSNTIRIRIDFAESEEATGGFRLLLTANVATSLPDGKASIDLTFDLKNATDHEIKAPGQEDPWYSNLALEVTNQMSGVSEAFPLRAPNCGGGVTPDSTSLTGELPPGKALQCRLYLPGCYSLDPGATYLITARCRLQTAGVPIDLVSNPVKVRMPGE